MNDIKIKVRKIVYVPFSEIFHGCGSAAGAFHEYEDDMSYGDNDLTLIGTGRMLQTLDRVMDHNIADDIIVNQLHVVIDRINDLQSKHDAYIDLES